MKEVTCDRWKVQDFENAASTTRTIRLVLREGVTLEHLPHELKLGSGTALVVVPGRDPMSFRCRNMGHVSRDCRVPRCAQCRAFGHGEGDCSTRFEPSGEAEEEAEGAAGSAGSNTEQDRPERTGAQEAKATEPQAVAPATPELRGPDAADTQQLPVSTISTPMNIDPVPPKRRLCDGPHEQRLRQLERLCEVFARNKRLSYPQQLLPLAVHNRPP